jgi:hypothetical protein
MMRQPVLVRNLLFRAALVGIAIIPTCAQSGNCTTKDSLTRPDCPGAITFFSRIQAALRRNNRMALTG